MDEAYVLITPARNEEDHIEKAIQSVISQTILPKKWIIVSDSSTDRTDEIVKQYMVKHRFIHLVSKEHNSDRNFASQVYALRAGIEHVKGIKYEFIGFLDADISFEPEYYELVLSKFQEDEKIGIAGGSLFEVINGTHRRVICGLWNVSGGIQLFQKRCYEDIGGYIVLNRGNFDGIACVMARMHGWKVKRFTDIRVLHHRRQGTAEGNIFSARFRSGIVDYSVSLHPVYAVAKFAFRIKEKPYFLGSLSRICGYCFASLREEPRPLPEEVIKYSRQEQILRLKGIILRTLGKARKRIP